jgi:PadR family transcriptional regulator, regulatory protein AphA
MILRLSESMKPFGFRLIEEQGHKFVEAAGDTVTIEDEEDVVHLIGACNEFDADRLMIHGEMLSICFFDLKSGKMGMLVQKLVNYRIKTAVLISGDQIRGTFGEFVVETNRGNHLRVFIDRQKAESWLLSD